MSANKYLFITYRKIFKDHTGWDSHSVISPSLAIAEKTSVIIEIISMMMLKHNGVGGIFPGSRIMPGIIGFGIISIGIHIRMVTIRFVVLMLGS
jgi:hypothetical protein